MKAEIIKPYGFCLGVKKTLQLTLDAREENPNKDIILLGYPIHNETVINNLLDKKIKVIDAKYDDLIQYIECFHDQNAIYILSAHGHANDIIDTLNKYNLTYIDTTCPFINKIHKNLENININDNVLYIGNENHVECITSLRHINSSKIRVQKNFTLRDLILDDDDKLVLTNQSTYFIQDILKDLGDSLNHAKNLLILDNFCPTIKARFEAIKKRESEFFAIIVIGSKTSSNANAILKYCNLLHKETFLINNIQEINDKLEFLNIKYENFKDEKRPKKIGIITATSAPSYIAEAICNIVEDYN